MKSSRRCSTRSAARAKTITFETYIYWSGDIGKKFSEALCERARAGVKVHVLLDAVGTGKIEEQYLDDLKAAGVEVEQYHPLRWYNVARINNRTHRKLLVVDGRIGFTGGVGIADLWNGHAQDPRIIGAIPTTSSKARRWRRCRRPSPTTGSRRGRRFSSAANIFPS